MEIRVRNPAFPKDDSKSKALTQEQFALVHDFLVDCLNSRKKIKDGEIIKRLADAGKPIDFGEETCKHCKASVKFSLETKQWISTDPDEHESTCQYCWIDPLVSSQRHTV